MDNIKSIELLGAHFSKVCGDTERSDMENLELYGEQRKEWEKAFSFYENNQPKPTGKNNITGQSLYPPLPKKGKDGETIGDAIWTVLESFSVRGCTPLQVRSMVEGFLDNVRKGWGKDMKKFVKSMGG